MKFRLSLLKTFIIGWLIAGLPFFVNAQSDSASLVKVGQQVPVFSVTDGHQTVDIAQLKGKVVWINFFATWCGPCRAELPELQKVYEGLTTNSKFRLLVIGRQHTLAEVEAFASSSGLKLPFFPDANRDVFNLFASSQIPRNIIVNGQGEIIYSGIGYDPDEFQKLVKFVEAELVK